MQSDLFFFFGGDISYSISICGCLLGDWRDLCVNCVSTLKRKTPPRKENHEFLPKSSNKIENKILRKNKLNHLLFVAIWNYGKVVCPRPYSKLSHFYPGHEQNWSLPSHFPTSHPCWIRSLSSSHWSFSKLTALIITVSLVQFLISLVKDIKYCYEPILSRLPGGCSHVLLI